MKAINNFEINPYFTYNPVINHEFVVDQEDIKLDTVILV
jgi:hypothetical protein